MFKKEDKENYNKAIDISSGIAIELVAALYAKEPCANYVLILIRDILKQDQDITEELNDLDKKIYNENKIIFLRLENENLDNIFKNKKEFSETLLSFKRMPFKY